MRPRAGLVALLLLTTVVPATAQTAVADPLAPLTWAGQMLGVGDRDLGAPLSLDESLLALGVLDPLTTRADIRRAAPSHVRDVERLLGAVAHATVTRRTAFAAVRDADVAIARTDPSALEGSRLIAAVDRVAMLGAAANLAQTASALRSSLRTLSLDEPTCFADRLLCIGTDGADRWADDVQILIDPAGDDTYLNNAGGSLSEVVFASAGGCALGGGSTGHAGPNLSCTAAPSALCTYDTANAATGRDDLPVIGVYGHTDPDEHDRDSGSCGNDARTERARDGISSLTADPDGRSVTLLLDLDGNDTYSVPWSHDDPLFGLIEDCFPGDASKVNTNRDFVQGASLAGIALLWDDGTGDDMYRGRLNAQGSGHVGGVGMLVTSGDGDATFWADRLSQGNGIAAGVGILSNTKTGTQTYLLDPPEVYRNEFSPNARDCQQEGRAGQGEGGFGGVGVLATLGGTTGTYRAITHVTTEGFPYAPVTTPDGSPRLVSGTDAQGSGESFPISATGGGVVIGGGLLVDRTSGDSRTCPLHARAGMLRGSTTSVGEDLSTIGSIDRSCGAFNLPSELDPARSLSDAISRVSGGAFGIRLVLPR